MKEFYVEPIIYLIHLKISALKVKFDVGPLIGLLMLISFLTW